MKTICFVITFALVMFISSPAVCRENAVAFTNVNLISMQDDGIIAAQTVIVEGDRITAIGPAAEVTPPIGAKVIDGTGLYLTPGLTDAHVHLDNKIGAKPDFGDAPLFLAYGITTVINLRGEAEHLDWKKRIKEGTLLAPNLYTSGEFVNEPRIKTPADAEREVAQHLRAGWDIIKFREVIDFEKHRILTTHGLEKSAYLRLNQAAQQAGIPIVGHAPFAVGLAGLLQAHQSLAHINELSNLYFFPPLELNKGTLMQLARWSLAILAGLLILWFIVIMVGRRTGRVDNQEFQKLKKSGFLAAWILLLTVVGFILWILVVPPGLFYGNLWLLILLSVLGLVDLMMVFTLIIKTIKMWRGSPVPIVNKILVTGISLACLGVSAALIHWVLFAWRGSDIVIDKTAKECKQAGIWVQSTLICQEIFFGIKEGYQGEQVMRNPAFRCLSPALQELWPRFLQYKPTWLKVLWKRQPEFNRHLIFSLHRQGVPLMAGTDAIGAPFIIPGLSLHQELRLLLESGLSPAEVLRCAAVGPAKFLGQQKEFGTIEVGKRADLLLVEGNPLEDLNHLLKLQGVMVRGIWLPKDELKINARLERQERKELSSLRSASSSSSP